MKIYISGPITGVKGYMRRFNEAEKLLKENGHEVINPARVLAQMPFETTHEEYMRMSITMMGMCDTILLLDGWKNSKGAQIEFDYAVRMGMTITFEGGVACQSQNKLRCENFLQRLVKRSTTEIVEVAYSAR